MRSPAQAGPKVVEPDRMSWGCTLCQLRLKEAPCDHTSPLQPSDHAYVGPILYLGPGSTRPVTANSMRPGVRERDGTATAEREATGMPLTSPGRLQAAHLPGHRARGSSSPRPHAAPAPRARTWDLGQVWRRGGWRNGAQDPQMTAQGAKPRETAGRTLNPQIVAQASFLPYPRVLGSVSRHPRPLLRLNTGSLILFFKQKQLDFNTGSFAFAPLKQ